MDKRCRFLKIVRLENGSETWTCYNQFQKRGLIQSCFLKKGECRYSNGPFPPEPVEKEDHARESRHEGSAKH